MSSPARRRAADRFRTVGVDDEAAAALAALAHPFDGPTSTPPSQVRASVQSEADAFRTASAGIDDAETLLWLGTTVADRYVTTAAGSGAHDLAAEFRDVREAMERGIRAARRGPLMPPVGPVTPSADAPRLAWPDGSGAGNGGPPPPPPAAATSGPPPPAWPGQSVEQAVAPAQPRRRGAVAILLAIPVVLLVVLGGFISLRAGTSDVDRAVLEVPAPPLGAPDGGGPEAPDLELPPPAPTLPDLDRASEAVFLAVLEPVARSEEAMTDFRVDVFEAQDEGLEGAALDAAIVEAADRAIATVRETQDELAAIDLEVDEAGDLAGVMADYRAHQEAWIGVWERTKDEPAIAYGEAVEPLDLYVDVNRTAEDFAAPFAAVVPRGLDPDDGQTVMEVLAGFGFFDAGEVLGVDDGSTV